MNRSLSFSQPAISLPWATIAWRDIFDWWTKSLFGVDVEHRRKQAAADAACTALERKLQLQIEVAGCSKTRSDRWNNAQFMRWQQYHAAAFELVYGILTDGITIKQARVFSQNFHYVEYLLAKRHRIHMEAWGKPHRDKLCELLRGNSQYFSMVRRFHRMDRARHRRFMNRLDAEFSPFFATTETN